MAPLPEGIAGIERFRSLVAHHAPDTDRVPIGIETERGTWVPAPMSAASRTVAINPRQAARFSDRPGTSGAESGTGRAHQPGQVAGDTDQTEGIKVLSRAHRNLI